MDRADKARALAEKHRQSAEIALHRAQKQLSAVSQAPSVQADIALSNLLGGLFEQLELIETLLKEQGLALWAADRLRKPEQFRENARSAGLDGFSPEPDEAGFEEDRNPNRIHGVRERRITCEKCGVEWRWLPSSDLCPGCKTQWPPR